MMNVFDEIKDALDTKTFKKIGRRGTGCISSGEAYETDNGLVFIKTNDGKEAMLMFLGELESLKALERTNTIRVPKPYIAIPDPQSEGGAIVMEYFDMQQLTNHTVLGEKLAQLHLHNSNLGKVKGKKESWVAGKRGASSSNDNETLEFVDKFGFEITTCCGYFPMTNDWLDNWVDFFARNRLEVQIRLIEEKCGDREALELWSHLQLRIPSFFKTLQEPIIPALLHGDLWSGNVSQVENEPVIYDPASFYGHSGRVELFP